MAKEIEIPEGYEAKIENNKVIFVPKESEDEKIRKELLEEIEFIIPHDDETDSEGLILPSYHARIDRYKSYLEKQKEQKPIFKKGDKVIWDDEEFNILDVNETEYNVGGYRVPFSRQNELHPIWQKSAEWSEEDKDMLNSCISSIEEAKENRYAYKETDGDTSYDHEIDWLKSLRPQPHKEIYQATKHDLAIKFMNYLDENRPEGKMSLSNAECEDIDKAFKENDWNKIFRYIEKYGRRN